MKLKHALIFLLISSLPLVVTNIGFSETVNLAPGIPTSYVAVISSSVLSIEPEQTSLTFIEITLLGEDVNESIFSETDLDTKRDVIIDTRGQYLIEMQSNSVGTVTIQAEIIRFDVLVYFIALATLNVIVYLNDIRRLLFER